MIGFVVGRTNRLEVSPGGFCGPQRLSGQPENEANCAGRSGPGICLNESEWNEGGERRFGDYGLEVREIFSRRDFLCAILAFFLVLAPLGRWAGAEIVPADPGRWSVSVGSLDVMGASEVRVTAMLGDERPRSLDLALSGFVRGTTEVRLLPGRPVGLELTGKVLADDLPEAAVLAVHGTFEGLGEAAADLPEGGLRLSDMHGYAPPAGPKPEPEFLAAGSAESAQGGGGCSAGWAWAGLLPVLSLILRRRA